jgi:demethylmenaquinone methyltransferase/2-methoxy-6-polyprenyl-1,4-benzoquinol methylase
MAEVKPAEARPTPRLADLDQRTHLDDPARHPRYIEVMFDEIAPRYDAFTRLFSFGMDRPWKHDLIRMVQTHVRPGAARALDLASGTGDLAVELAEAVPGLSVEGIDVAAEMVARAQPHPRVVYRQGDASRLDVVAGSIDVVTVGYGLRNFTDHRPTLAGIAAALSSGGVLGVLDFTRPAFAPWRWIFLSYLWLTGYAMGWLWHRHGPTYSYIARSIARFTTRAGLIADAQAVGLQVVAERSQLGGGVALVVFRKP